MSWTFKDLGLATIYSYIVITILNYLVHYAFPAVPVLKTGVAILIFFVGIIIASLFTFTRDGKFDAEDVKGFLVIVVVVIALYFGIRFALPDLFSTLVPDYTKEVFSIFPW